MSEVSPIYLLKHAGYRILEFFRHWYLDGFLRWRYHSINSLEKMDRVFAVKINLHNLFQPLYQDYSLIGYFWGFIFRSLRVTAGILVYGTVQAVFVVLYLLWAALPVFAIYQIIKNAV